jgi:perosamine synthetase
MSGALPWWEPVLGAREKLLLGDVIDSGFPNDGEWTTAFEKRVAEVCGVPYAVAVTSGTAAIFLALAASGIGPGDEVIVPDVTFIATANAVRLAGATPVLVDVRVSDLNIDPEAVERAITPRTRAVVPVHVSGRASDMPALASIATRHSLRIVEDAAEAFGSRLGGRALGSFGVAGCFSFSPNKTVTTGQGGMVVTSDPEAHQCLRELKDQGRPVRGTGGADEHVSLGYNFKLTNLQAAVGLAQMEALAERLEHQRQLYAWYQEGLEGVAGVRLLEFDVAGGEVPQWVDALVDDRDAVHDRLRDAGIATRKFWHPLHTQAPYRRDPQAFPVSAEVGAKGLWLPSALRLAREDVARVCHLIRRRG